MAPLKKKFSHDGVTHEMTVLVMAPLNLDNFVRVQDYVGRVMANPSSHGGDCSRHKKSAARNGDSPLRYAPFLTYIISLWHLLAMIRPSSRRTESSS